MTIPDYLLNPSNGYLNTVTYPNPANGAVARAQVNDLVFQVLGNLNDYKNKLQTTTLGSSGAENIGYPDATNNTIYKIIQAILSAGSGTIPPDRTITYLKIALGTITNAEIASGTITSTNIQDGSILLQDLQDTLQNNIRWGAI